MGGVLRAADAILKDISNDNPQGALEIVDGVAVDVLGGEDVDTLRLQGMKSALTTLDGKLSQLQAAIEEAAEDGGLQAQLEQIRTSLDAIPLHSNDWSAASTNAIDGAYDAILAAIAARRDRIADLQGEIDDRLASR
jgi:hypothetical protein